MKWTSAKIDELRRLLVVEKLSGARAAKRMGLTRNQIIGKASREGISIRGLPWKRKAKPEIIPILIIPPEPLMLTLLELTEHTCKYPVGEATGIKQIFCGAPKDIEIGYCRYHCQVAYRPATPRIVRDMKRQAERFAA